MSVDTLSDLSSYTKHARNVKLTNPFIPEVSPRRNRASNSETEFKDARRSLLNSSYHLNQSVHSLRQVLTAFTVDELPAGQVYEDDVFSRSSITEPASPIFRTPPPFEQLTDLRDAIISLKSEEHADADELAYKLTDVIRSSGLNGFTVLEGEGTMRRLLQICVKSHAKKPYDDKEEDKIIRLRKTLLKECGFSVRVRLVPLVTYRKAGNVNVDFLILLCLENKKSHQIIVNHKGQVFRDVDDWRKHTHLHVFTKFFVCDMNQRTQTTTSMGGGSPMKTFTLTRLTGPSARNTRYRRHLVDATVIAVAIGTGCAAVLVLGTGGIALPIAFGGAQLLAVTYMSVRGISAIAQHRKHRPKFRS